MEEKQKIKNILDIIKFKLRKYNTTFCNLCGNKAYNNHLVCICNSCKHRYCYECFKTKINNDLVVNKLTTNKKGSLVIEYCGYCTYGESKDFIFLCDYINNK